MRGPGIIWMLQTAAGMSMAGPLFYLGGTYVLAGRYAGGAAFLLFGTLVLYFPTFLVNRIGGRVKRIGGPRTWVKRRLGRGGDGARSDANGRDERGTDGDRSTAAVAEDAETDETGETGDTGTDGDDGPTLLERLQR